MNTWLLTGIMTWYAGGFVGQPLYCDRPGEPLTYSVETPAWVALPVEEFESGRARCGDLLVLSGNGWKLEARALDAGPLGDYSVGGERIVADVPLHLWPRMASPSTSRPLGWARSGPVTVENVSARARARLGLEEGNSD